MDFDNIAVNIDSECISQDFDNVDLFGEIMIEDGEETDINFE